MQSKPIIVKQEYDSSIDKVWNAITDIKLMRQWYFDSIELFEPVVGFETRFNVQSNNKSYLHIWKVTEVEFQKRITYSWRYEGFVGNSFVVWELSKKTNCRTCLKLTCIGLESFPKGNPDFSRESCTAGWKYFVCRRLRDFLEQADK